MATMNSGLGGAAGYGEDTFSTTSKFTGGNDDGSVQIDVTSVFSGGLNFFGTNYSEIYINSNGAITFGSASDSYDVNGLDDFSVPALAPFYADIDITQGGEIYWDLDPSNGKITITWDSVKSYDGGAGANSFQVVLTDTGNGEFGIEYIYGDIQWGNVSPDPATTGFTDGAGTDYELEGSNNTAALQGYETNDFDNGDAPGTWSTFTVGGTPDILTVDGTSGADNMTTGFTDVDGDQITSGDDVIDSAEGDDFVDGGAGDDTIFGLAGADTISGGGGGAFSYTQVGPSDDFQGSTWQDAFEWTPIGSTSSATIRFNNSSGAATRWLAERAAPTTTHLISQASV